MAKRLRLMPAQQATVKATGLHAYKHNLRNLKPGVVAVELVLEPDNPHDDHAISIRKDGKVLGYVPRDRTRTYWPLLARLESSGYEPTIKARHHRNGSYHELSLFLLSNPDCVPRHATLQPADAPLDVEDAFDPNANLLNPRSPKFADDTRHLGTVAPRHPSKEQRETPSTPAGGPAPSDWLPTPPPTAEPTSHLSAGSDEETKASVWRTIVGIAVIIILAIFASMIF